MFEFLKWVGEGNGSLLMTRRQVCVFSAAAWISFFLLVKVAVPQCTCYPANLQATRLKCSVTQVKGNTDENCRYVIKNA